MIKKFTNAQIFALSNKLETALSAETRYMPARISYFIHKNRTRLAEQMGFIEKSRMDIIHHYGTMDPVSGAYSIPDDKLTEANKELEELLNIELDFEISMIKLSDLESIDFTLD
jgi:hypothetical protein